MAHFPIFRYLLIHHSKYILYYNYYVNIRSNVELERVRKCLFVVYILFHYIWRDCVDTAIPNKLKLFSQTSY